MLQKMDVVIKRWGETCYRRHAGWLGAQAGQVRWDACMQQQACEKRGELTLRETCRMVRLGKQPREMDCLMMQKAALIMAWLATHAAAVANTNTNCSQHTKT